MTTIELLGLTAITAILFTFVSAWMNEKIISLEKERRKVAEVLNLVIVWALIAWLSFGESWLSVAVFLMPIVLRFGFFDLILNKLLGWDLNYRGTTSKIDRLNIPQWVKFAVVLIFIILVIWIIV